MQDAIFHAERGKKLTSRAVAEKKKIFPLEVKCFFVLIYASFLFSAHVYYLRNSIVKNDLIRTGGNS